MDQHGVVHTRRRGTVVGRQSHLIALFNYVLDDTQDMEDTGSQNSEIVVLDPFCLKRIIVSRPGLD